MHCFVGFVLELDVFKSIKAILIQFDSFSSLSNAKTPSHRKDEGLLQIPFTFHICRCVLHHLFLDRHDKVSCVLVLLSYAKLLVSSMRLKQGALSKLTKPVTYRHERYHAGHWFERCCFTKISFPPIVCD